MHKSDIAVFLNCILSSVFLQCTHMAELSEVSASKVESHGSSSNARDGSDGTGDEHCSRSSFMRTSSGMPISVWQAENKTKLS